MAIDFTQGTRIPKDVREFLEQYRIEARITDRQRAVYNPIDYDPFSYSATYMTREYKKVPVINLELTEEDFERLMDDVTISVDIKRRYGPNIEYVIDRAQREEWRMSNENRIRQDNPGVQLAWEKYQTMLKIAGG